MHVLMIESNPAGIEGILKAVALGHHITFLTADPSFYLHESAHAEQAFSHEKCRLIHDQNIFSIPHVVQLARRVDAEIRVDGVMTYSEYHTVHASEVAKAMHLPGMNPDAARRARYKHLTRTALAENGIPQPRFRHVQGKSDRLHQAIAEVGFPCIVKPADGTASLHVVHLDGWDKAATYLETMNGLASYGRGVVSSRDFLVEEFVPGELVSVESCVTGKDGVRNFGITDRRLVGFPHFIEMGGTFFLDHPERERLFALNEQTLDALGVDHGFIHTEFILGPQGPVVVEVNARLAGGILPRMFEAASGIDPLVEVVHLSLGEKPRLPLPLERVATGRQFGSRVAGIFQAALMDGLAASEGFVNAVSYPKPGTPVSSLSKSNFDWIGHVIFTGRNRAESLWRAEEALKKVHLRIDIPVAV